MMSNNKKVVIMVASIIAIFAVATVHVPSVYPVEPTADNKLSDFLSSVVGLDLTKYARVTEESSVDFSYPEKFGGLVQKQVISPKFEYADNEIGVMSIFYNGHLEYLKLNAYSEGVLVYSESPPPDILSQAKSLLQRYQTFASQNYEKDTSYLVPMQNILNSVDDLTPMEFTEGNVTFKVSKDGDNTRIQWIYTEGGILMERKRVYIKYRINTFASFRDTWGLFSVSGLSATSSEEAVEIAREAAQKYELRIGHENGTIETVKVPDLSDAPHSVSLTMVPYSYDDEHIPSRIERDPLTLYPYWAVLLYFNETIAGVEGMQVGVWGDTGEILCCSGFGYLGTSGPPTEQGTPSQPHDEESTEEPTQTTPDPSLGEQNQLNGEISTEEQNQSNSLNPLTLAIVASIVAVPILSVSVIALLRKNRHN